MSVGTLVPDIVVCFAPMYLVKWNCVYAGSGIGTSGSRPGQVLQVQNSTASGKLSNNPLAGPEFFGIDSYTKGGGIQLIL